MDHYFNTEISDYKVSEEDKSKPQYLMAYMDHMIQDLVVTDSYRRKLMGKMRDMYEGIRDPEEYAYLTDNYGIGNPSDVKFTPIIRNRIEALIGLLSTTSFDWKLTIVDPETVRVADIMKSAEILKDVYANIDRMAKQQASVSESIEVLVMRAKNRVDKDWRSVFEETANNLIEHFRQNPSFNLNYKRSILLEDIAVVGECLYRTLPDRYGHIPKSDVLIPENFYYDLPRDKKFIKEAQRGVYISYKTREEILTRWGHLMDDDQRKEVLEIQPVSRHMLIASGVEIDRLSTRPGEKKRDSQRYLENGKYIPVYECEWIANNTYDIDKSEVELDMNVDGPDKVQAKGNRQDRYQGLRIGETVYLNMGKSEFVERDMNEPDMAYLSFNGVRFSDRNGDPYSIVWKCKDIQDMHDIMMYHRDNLVANSGVNGSRLNVAGLPKFLGADMMERLMKVIALRKQGVDPVDASQDGAGQFNHYGDFKNSLEGTTITGINAVIDQLDMQATKITGVTPQMMGLIEQREAVSNVKLGVNQASLVIKNFYDHHDMVMQQMLTDMLKMTQMAMSEHDYIATLIGEAGVRAFKLIPRNYAFSTFNLVVTSTSNEFGKLQEIKNMANQMVSAQLISPQLAFKVIKSDSVNEVISMVERELAAENLNGREVQLMKQKVDELTKQNESLQGQIKQHDQARLDIDREKNQIAREKMNWEYGINKEKNEIARDKNSKEIELKKETVKLERDQLFLEASGNSKEVKNNI